ncbi:hypothetical protein OfM1_20270 [Lactovum odontotermitis]
MKSAYEIVPLNSVKKYLKKLKDRRLKELFVDLIYSEIAENPYDGIEKKGDLSGIWVRKLRYKRTDYRVAYLIEDDEDKKLYLFCWLGLTRVSIRVEEVLTLNKNVFRLVSSAQILESFSVSLGRGSIVSYNTSNST